MWALTFREFCMYADLLDRIADEHKKAGQRQRSAGRGRKRGR